MRKTANRLTRGTLFRRNETWYFKQMIDGRVFCKSCKTTVRAEAEKIAHDYTLFDVPKADPKVRVAAMVEFLKPDAANPTLDEAVTVYCNHPKCAAQSESAQSTDMGRWRFFLWWLHGHDKARSRVNRPPAHPEITRLGEISPAVATEFIRFAQSNTSAATVNKYLRVYRRIWNFNAMEKNPWNDFTKLPAKPVQRRALTKDEIKYLIFQADGELRTLFTIGPYTGMRLSDCAKLKWENVTPDLSVLYVQPHKTAHSSGKRVAIPIHPTLRQELVTRRPRKTGYILPALAQMPEWGLSDAVQAHFRKCGMEEFVKEENHRRRSAIVGFHSFRSTFITMLAESGAPLAMVQSIVGHVSPELTQLYYRADTERARTYIDRL